ncbi:MAG: alkaline phosphatase family protein [Sedimenticola sp.]
MAEKVLTKVAKLEGYVALHKVPPELFEWLDMPEREDMFQASDIGGAPTFLSDARDAGLSVYSAPWQLPEKARWKDSHDALKAQKPDLAFLYATALDGIMHSEGPNGSVAPDAAVRIASNIERARDIMSTDGSNLTTLVVGDHGMAEVNGFIDPRKMLARLNEMRLFVDSTMIRAWGTDKELSQLRLEIEKENWPGKWLRDEELASRKVPNDNIFGRAIYVLDEGNIFAPSFLGGRVAGMHGYDTGCSCTKAALASDCPIDDNVTGIDDIANIVRIRLNLV